MPTLEEALGKTLAAIARQPIPDQESLDSLRGQVLAKAKLWIPDEVKAEDVVVYIEANAIVPPPPPPPNSPFVVEVDESGTESGHCSFTRSYSASGSTRLTLTDIRRALSGCSDREEALSALEDLARDRACLDYDYENERTENYETTDSDRDDWDSNASSVLDQIFEAYPELDPDHDPDYCGDCECSPCQCEEEEDEPDPE